VTGFTMKIYNTSIKWITLTLFFTFHEVLSFAIGYGRGIGSWLPQTPRMRRNSNALSLNSHNHKVKVLPHPMSNSIGVFFENNTNGISSFIECNMLSCIRIDNEEYGVGFPADSPVALAYYDNTTLLWINSSYPMYQDILDHITAELDNQDIELYHTPVVLTMCDGGDDDEEENKDNKDSNNDTNEDDDVCVESQEITSISDLIQSERINDINEVDITDEDESSNNDSDAIDDSIYKEPSEGVIDSSVSPKDRITDYSLTNMTGNDEISVDEMDYEVTEEDERLLEITHKRYKNPTYIYVCTIYILY
jgi:hypothetical protein